MRQAGWYAIVVQVALLAASVGAALWETWRSDSAFSHGPLVPVVALALAWTKRDQLRGWGASAGAGLAVMTATGFLYVTAIWAGVTFLPPLAIMGAIFGLAWYLGDLKMAKTCAAPIGFLAFMIPWPTLLVDRLSFPLQLMSSTYATMLGGMAGLPLHREGVNVAVIPDPQLKPVYSMVVARECSGLTSMIVLLALGYLVAFITPVRPWIRGLLFASVVPLALLTNAVRLTVILVFGAHSSPQMAQWVHDNEGPVLIFVCGVLLLVFRRLAIAMDRSWDHNKGDSHAPAAPAAG